MGMAAPEFTSGPGEKQARKIDTGSQLTLGGSQGSAIQADLGRLAMSMTAPAARYRLTADPGDILQRLPSMGRVMILSSLPAVTHERIGVVASVARESGVSIQSGSEHDSRIVLADIAEMIVDRSGGMGDKVYPRIDFLDADGAALFGVVGFEGLERFDGGLEGLPAADAPAKADGPVFEKGPDVSADDAATRAFQRVLDSGAEVTVRLRRPGFEQAWSGRVEAIKPSMGFVNVMRPDFHLHVKGGAVRSWSREGNALHACGATGEALGLSILGLDEDL